MFFGSIKIEILMSIQCDQTGRFWKVFFATNYLVKLAQIFVDFLGRNCFCYLESCHTVRNPQILVYDLRTHERDLIKNKMYQRKSGHAVSQKERVLTKKKIFCPTSSVGTTTTSW